MLRQILSLISIIIIFFADMNSQNFFSEPLSHTYSIVARDLQTGEMGVAVQSHWFNVGAVVPWGEAGTGIVATQSFTNISFGVRGLELLKDGLAPGEVIDSLLSDDEGREYRQVAVLDSKGRIASYTGKNCIPSAGSITGDNFSVQANLMLNDNVIPAMADAYKNSSGHLAERMIAAMQAAQDAGGDIRGRQSAAILIFKGESSGKVWEDKIIDLRVEDNTEPVKELSRLLKVHRAYEHMNNGDLAVEKGNMKKAMEEYSTAEKMFPENQEMKFWHAVTLANNGNTNEALPMFREIFRANEKWKILLPRLIPVKLLNITENELNYILKE